MALGGGPLWLAGMVGVSLVPGVVQAHSNVFCFQADVLGAPANFVITATSREVARLATTAAMAEIERLEHLLSSYKADSELSRLNDTSEMSVSPELFEVLEMAESLRVRTSGAFNARMGAIEALWRNAGQRPPDGERLRAAAQRANQTVLMDPTSRMVSRPSGVVFSIDALAKGYIIDRAMDAACATVLPAGILIDIGGDMRCHGCAGSDLRWPVGLSDPRLPFINAPLVGRVALRNQAIATSGRGPRDRMIGDAVYSTTFSPATGWPIKQNLAATVVAPTAADADGFATALLVMDPQEGLELAGRSSGVEARITQADGEVLMTPGWARLEAGLEPMQTFPFPAPVQIARGDTLPNGAAAAGMSSGPPVGPSGWVIDWSLKIFYDAPPVDPAERSDFRSPYLAMWISDKQNQPIRTLVLVGGDPKYQKENIVWWSLYGDRAPKILQLRTAPTSISGPLPTVWPGYDDDYKYVAPGEYFLNIETSQEHGKHTFRAIPFSIGRSTFETKIAPTADDGEVKLVFGKIL